MRIWTGLALCLAMLAGCKNEDPGKAGGVGAVEDSGSTDETDDTDGPDDPDDTAEPDPPVPTRIEVSQQSALLTEGGDTVTLEATVIDQYGEELADQTLEWASNDPDTVTVDGGVATAVGDWGSALLTVSVGDLRSTPVTVLVADPVDGAILVDDSAVSGAEAVNPDVPVDVGWQYLVELDGIDVPSAGDVLVSTGDAGISGRVVSVIDDGSPMVVLMEGMAPADLFDELEFSEIWTAEDVLASVPEGMEGLVEVVETDDGYIEWSTPEGELPPSLIGMFANAFECESGVGAPVLEVSGFSMKVKREGWHLDLQMNGIGLKRLAIEGRLEGDVRIKMAANAAFEGEIKCEAQFLKFPLPVGPMGAVFGPSLDLGAGMEIKGRYTAASLSIEPYATMTVSMELGLDCESGCRPIQEFSQDVDAGVAINNGDPSLTSSVEVGAKTFVYAKLTMGARIVGVPIGDDIDVLVVEGGLSAAGTFMLEPVVQADDSTSASSLELSTYISAGLPPAYSETIGKMFKVEVGTLGVELSNVFARTPIGTFSKLDDLLPLSPETPVTLEVDLDDAYVSILGIYNVAEVVFYHRDSTLPIEDQMTELARVAPDADGQTLFEYEWTPTAEQLEAALDGSGEEVFPSLYAFVVPAVNPWPDMEYEVASNSEVPLSLNVLTWTGDLPVLGGVDVGDVDDVTGSIDDSGRVGFIGDDSSGQERPYTWSDAAGLVDMADFYSVERSYTGGAIASGQGLAASDTGAGFNFVRIWEETDATTIGCGEGCYGTHISMEFGAAIGFMDINTAGDVSFYTLDQSTGYDPYSGYDIATVRVFRSGVLQTVGTETEFLLRPTMSESGTIVWRDSSGRITINGSNTVGSTSAGLAPGISGNGDRVAWVDGDTIYYSSAASGWAEVAILDAGSHPDVGSVELDERLGVGLVNKGGEDIIFVVFLGTDASGTPGVFAVQTVDGAGEAADATFVTALALDGDVFGSSTVSDFYLYDPVSPGGHIAVRVGTGSTNSILRFLLD